MAGWGQHGVSRRDPSPSHRPVAGSGDVHYSHSRCYRPHCKPASPPRRSPREGHSHGDQLGTVQKKTPQQQTRLRAPPQTQPHWDGGAGRQCWEQWDARAGITPPGKEKLQMPHFVGRRGNGEN